MTTSARQFVSASLLATLGAIVMAAVAVGQTPSDEVIISTTLKPAQLEVATGTSVTWRNADAERHRIRSREGPVEFDSGNLEPGETFSFTFVVEGIYAYVDHRNDEDPAYFGSVVVGPAVEAGEGPLPMSASVMIIDESFQPPTIEIATGGTVEWANIDGDDQHTATSTEGTFNSGILEAGTTFSQVFEVPGTYPYTCGIHPEMFGTVTVTGPAVEVSLGPASSAAPTTNEPEVSVGSSVSIIDFAFTPPTVEVSVGTTVDWSNDDVTAHTVTSIDGVFDSGSVSAGSGYSQTFDEAGTFDFSCLFHPFMQGTVVVTVRPDG